MPISVLASQIGELLRQPSNALPSAVLQEVQRLLHEIELRHCELEQQNEELRQTQRHLDTAESRREEDRLRTMVESAPCAMVMTDAGGRIVLANAQAEKLFGYRREELIGQSVELLVPEQLRGQHSDDRRSYMADPQMRPMGIGRDLYARRKDGSQVPVEIGLSAVKTKEGMLILASMADITERKRAEAALQQAKADAEKANQAKSRFLAYVSHDLRTPMNAILGMVGLALEKTAEPSVKDYLQTAKDSADLLLALLNDLLDCAKIESGKLALEAAPFSLRRVLDQTTRVLTVRATQKGISFSCSVLPDAPDWLVGDHVRLRQILLNLAGNGIKFTEQGEVAISVRVESQTSDETRLEFAVRDTGIGILPCDVNRIFQPFAQADLATARRFGGTGLGLAISSSLVAMMGGRIWVESEPEKGSTFRFTVRLPLAKQPPVELDTGPDVLAPSTASLRVLVVEDNPANQKLAAYILNDRGHTVEIAGDGRQALRMAQENTYDAILMDVSLPGMDGLETTAAIRAQERGEPRVPIIAVTASAMQGDRERCLEVGMNGFLSKPINGRQMIALVESLASGKPVPAEQGISSPAAVAIAPATPEPPAAEADVFDQQEAIKRCFGRQEMFRTMVSSFFKDVERLLSEMRSALQRGDVPAVGELGHRLKGTVVYLGAKRAADAALRVEKFARSGGQLSDAEEAVSVLEWECEALKMALARHQFNTSFAQDETSG